MKSHILFASSLLAVSTAYNQGVNERVDSTTRSLPSPTAEAAAQTNSEESSDTISSDTGAQRPLKLNNTGISGLFGYESLYSYKQSPLGAPGVLDQQSDAVWENKFHGRAKLGVYDLDSSVVTPFIGGSWSMTDFTYKNDNEVVKDLSTLNFNTTTAYVLFLMQHESGWSFRGGVMYANDRSTESDTEEYMEFYPSVGATKAYALNEHALSVVDASFGAHYGTIEDVDNTGTDHTDDELDHIDLTASYSIIYSFDNFTIRPSYSASYRKYDNGFNFDREDILHHVSIHIDYPISDAFELSVFSDYSKRTSEGTHKILYEFEKFSVGTGIGLTASF